MVLDRSSGRLTSLRENHLVSFTAGGRLGLGPDLLVDPDTFEYLAVLPPVNPFGFPVFYDWSPDGRFATYGHNRHGGTTRAPSVEPEQSVEEALADGVVTAEEYAHGVSNTLACMDANGLGHSSAWFDSGPYGVYVRDDFH